MLEVFLSYWTPTDSACSTNTFFLPTMVTITRPFKVHLWNGLFFDLLALVVTSKTHSWSGLKMVTSASAPTLRVPFFKFNRRAGFTVYFAITSESEMRFV